MTIETSITIKATKDAIWQVLMNFSEYPEWNPFILSITGEPIIGKQININLPEMKFKPIVLTNQKEQLFSWKGKLGIKEIFDGHHQFEIQQLDEQHCLFIHREVFSGILVPLFKKKLQTKTRQGFEAMNIALKNRAKKA
ncbi:SRPBCC domain-containing protein [Myroides odoratimimus]|uniref:SRPBCC domain-containing protein n=1 Tax=Myroides odoratimimus TaxID=76832 RepID=UPI00310128BE